MRIDKLELAGFKSFSERTILNFHSGITCIVGPNGCGKSNIVDAFRWVLGEQSAKSLRSEKMEEVIFNGSASKKPRGMAAVTMEVSGLNGAGSPDGNGDEFSDIANVTRRLYRSGESEYMLNKNQCRLKDIKDLFLDTGLGVKSYSVFEQARISEILNSKPLERRFLIEEVAGIMKYNARKKEAKSKLESSRANLQRLNDIITEVKKQINFLDRLARKAERYKKLSSEIRSIELKIAKRDYQVLRGSLEEVLSEYNTIREEESLRRAELTKNENRTETRRLELVEKEKALEDLQRELQTLEKEIAELEKTVAISRTDRDNLKEYLARLYQQEEELTIKREEVSSRKEELGTVEGELLSSIEMQNGMLREKSNLVRSLEGELSEQEELLESKRREVFRTSEEYSDLRNELSWLRASLEELEQREASSQRDTEQLRSKLVEIDSSIKDTEGTIQARDRDVVLLKEKRETLAKEISSNRNRAQELQVRLSDLREEIASYRSRLESLREIVFDQPTRDLLSEGSGLHLLASLSDVLEVEPEYEKAIESALSEKVNLLILSSLNDIEIAVSSLREKGLNRTAFMTINPPMSTETIDVPDGAIGKASYFVRTKEEFSDVAKALLGNVFIVRDLTSALNLRTTGKRLFFVTLDGEVIEPSGAVIGGEIRGILKRKREIRELEGTIESKRIVMRDVENELISIQGLIESRESEIKDIETSIVDAEKEGSILRLTADNYREEKARIEKRITYLTTEAGQLSREKEYLQRLITEKGTEVQSAEAKKIEMEQENASLMEEITKGRSRLESSRAEVTDLRLSIASLKEKLESVIREREAMLEKIEEIDRKKEFLSREISSVDTRISQREAEMMEYEDKIKSLVSAADLLRVEIREKREVVEDEHQELLKAEQDLKLLRRQIESLSQRVSELDISRAEYRLRIENLTENISQNYGTDIDTLEVELFTTEDEKRLTLLREKLQELGPTNLGTIDEYEELRTRYEFLTKQREDLNKSIAELEEAIRRIDANTRRRLWEAYHALREKFAEVFSILFDGGTADIVLTDEDNILETGIDIIAQPPGKKLQNIDLLSGGEKALTALSLLFASFLIKPTPLCIMDEADATLDDSNTDRFAKMLQELSKDIQFIVVTHNKTTMSVADYLYGVTMEEAGVSKIISLQLVEA